MTLDDLAYYQHRHAECTARANSASDPAIARIQREFAEEYARKLAEITPLLKVMTAQ